MTRQEDPPSDEISLGDVLRPVLHHRRLIARLTVLAMVLAALVGGTYFWVQPQRATSTIGFRPVFEGAAEGRYPNGLRFAPGDIVETSIVNEVFDANHMEEFCPRQEFQRSLTVEQASPELQFLELEYQGRLADVRLTSVDRQRIQDEYAARRRSLPAKHRLHFIRPPACRRLPGALLEKALSDILKTWAEQSEKRRGVLMVDTTVLSPSAVDATGDSAPSLMVRADLVRSAIVRVIANIAVVQRMAGAQLVKLPNSGGSFAELRDRLNDLIRARLDSLVVAAGRNQGPDAIAWLQEAIDVAGVEAHSAALNVETYRSALREFSGLAGPPSTAAPAASKPQSADVQSLTPQIDQTFVDRIIGMSGPNTAFRQDMTQRMIEAGLAKVRTDQIVEHYRQMLAAIQQARGRSLPDAEVKARLTGVIDDAKQLTQQFNALYDEFSRVSLRPVPQLYVVDEPAGTTMLRAFSMRDLGFLVAASGVFMFLLAVVGAMVEAQWRRLVGTRA